MGEMIEFEGVSAYKAEPAGQVVGGLIVIHEIWGLVDHIKNVADRFAAEGYVVIAPDLLSAVGTTPEVGLELFAIMTEPDEAKRLAGQPRLRDAFAPVHAPEFAMSAVASLMTTVDHLEAEPEVDGRIGVTGFCFGGSFSFALAAADSRVKVAVPWYGAVPDPASIASIACPVLGIYGSIDESIMEGLPAVTAAMRDAGVDFTSMVYEGAKHAFFNDTSSNYAPDAADDAWSLTLSFLRERLANSR